MSDSTRNSPLHPVHEAAGATFTDFGGWNMPLKYGSELAEHKAVRTSAGLFDLSHMGEIRVTGPEAGAMLDHALSSVLSTLKPGRAKYALCLTDAGTVLDDTIVYRMDDGEAGSDDHHVRRLSGLCMTMANKRVGARHDARGACRRQDLTARQISVVPVFGVHLPAPDDW